ncbi:MAG: hypothetical protein LRY51_05130 [Geovibrio sp.]|nr:hypothetical protein [Geovibrio sp.]
MRDHQSLKHIDENTLRLIKHFAELQDITVCVEVFEEDAFLESLDILLNL